MAALSPSVRLGVASTVRLTYFIILNALTRAFLFQASCPTDTPKASRNKGTSTKIDRCTTLDCLYRHFCRTCKKDKPLSQFGTRDGLTRNVTCRNCVSAACARQGAQYGSLSDVEKKEHNRKKRELKSYGTWVETNRTTKKAAKAAIRVDFAAASATGQLIIKEGLSEDRNSRDVPINAFLDQFVETFPAGSVGVSMFSLDKAGKATDADLEASAAFEASRQFLTRGDTEPLVTNAPDGKRLGKDVFKRGECLVTVASCIRCYMYNCRRRAYHFQAHALIFAR